MKCGDANNPQGPFMKPNGSPCLRNCRPGYFRCSLHGGNNPAAKIKAEQMMAQCRLPAIETLFTIIEQFDSNTCPTCGFPKGDTDEKRMIVRACQTVLDRAGMGPHAVLEISRQLDGDFNLELLTDIERGQLMGHLAQIREIKDAVRSRQTAMVSDSTAALHGRNDPIH